jgi:hypothetical protein
MPFQNEGMEALKSGDSRSALRALRESRAAGDTDKRTAELIRELEANAGSVRVTITGINTDRPPSPVIVLPQGGSFEADQISRNRFTFRDVPADTALDLEVATTGYQPFELTVEPVSPRRETRLDAELTWLGTATLELTDWPEGVQVIVTDVSQRREPSEEGSLELTAGRVVVALEGSSGKRQFLLELAADASQAVAVRDELPGAVLLAGVPAGSRLRLDSSPEGARLTTSSVAKGAVASEQDGVGIAEPVLLKSLPPGAYTLAVDHPILGSGRVSFEPVPGETTDAALLWESMSQAAAVREARRDWERRKAKSERVPMEHWLALGGAGVSVAAAGVSTAMLIRSGSVRSELGDLGDSYDQALDDRDYDTAWDLFYQRTSLQNSLRSSNTVTLGGLGITVGGLGASATLYLRGRNKKRGVESWDLWSLTDLERSPEPARLPSPAPEPEDEEPEPEPAGPEPAEPVEEAQPADDDEFYEEPEQTFEPDFEPEDEEFELEPASGAGA